MENKVKKILQAARDLLAKPGQWTTGALARSSNTTEQWRGTSPTDPHAGSWCSIGAIQKVAHDQKIPKECVLEAQKVLAFAISGREASIYAESTIIGWNDGRRLNAANQERIIAKFDKAIELADERGVKDGE